MTQEPDANPWHNHRTFRPKIMAILKENNLVTFEQRQDVGTEGEKIFCDYLRKQGLDPITIDQPFKPFDVFESISGTTYKVESCFEAWKDDTIFIELRRSLNGSWHDIGLLNTRADAWAFVTHKDILVIATEDLKNIIVRENCFRVQTTEKTSQPPTITAKVDFKEIIKYGQKWER